jgi:predicted RNA binding protein with dsRBD fold (UPF0201 family)
VFHGYKANQQFSIHTLLLLRIQFALRELLSESAQQHRTKIDLNTQAAEEEMKRSDLLLDR